MPSLLPDRAKRPYNNRARRELAAARGIAKSKDADHYRPHEGNPATSDHTYEDDEVEFMMAMDTFKVRTGHQFPRWSEVLGVLKSLGYSK